MIQYKTGYEEFFRAYTQPPGTGLSGGAPGTIHQSEYTTLNIHIII